MKLVIISNLFPPFVRGGAELVAAASAKALKARGHEVTVITACPEKSGSHKYEVEEGEWEGLKVLRFFPHELYFTLDDHKHHSSTRLLWHIQDTFNVYSAGVIRKILKEIKPDAVITHNLKGIGLLVPSVIRELKIPHVHTLHDVQLIEPSGLMLPTEEPTWLRALKFLPMSTYRTITRFLFSSPALVISPTNWLLMLHCAHFFFPKSETLVLQNPVRETKVDTRTASGAPSKPRFVFVGQIETHKGIIELLEAWKEAEKNPDFQAELDIIGDGTLLGTLREQIGFSERIHFHGRLPNEKVMRVLHDATALVFPSKCLENAPGAVLEALSLSVPVLASEIGGVPEFVKKGQTGWLVKPGDIPELSRMLRHVAAHPKEIAMLKQNLDNRPKMTVEKYADLLEKSCQKLLTE